MFLGESGSIAGGQMVTAGAVQARGHVAGTWKTESS